MPKRKLRFVRSEMAGVWGVCELCNWQFKSMLRDVMAAGREIEAQFAEHDCKREDISLRDTKQKN